MRGIRYKVKWIALGGGLLTIASLLALIESLWGLISSKPLIPESYGFISQWFPILPRYMVISIWATVSTGGMILVWTIFRSTRVNGLGFSTEERVASSEYGSHLGFYDYLVDGPKAVKEVGRILDAMAKSMQRMSGRLGRHTKRLSTSQGQSEKMYKAASDAAEDIYAHDVQLEGFLPKFENSVERFRRNYLGIINWLTEHGEENWRESMDETFDALEAFGESLKTAIDGTVEYRDSVSAQLRRNISVDLDESCHALKSTLDRIVSLLNDMLTTTVEIAAEGATSNR